MPPTSRAPSHSLLVLPSSGFSSRLSYQDIMDFDLRIGEWDDWWEQTFVQNAATAQNPDVADQQHIFSDIPQGQESGQWTSDQDIRR